MIKYLISFSNKKKTLNENNNKTKMTSHLKRTFKEYILLYDLLLTYNNLSNCIICFLVNFSINQSSY